jgi:hypothetical protein
MAISRPVASMTRNASAASLAPAAHMHSPSE